MPNTIRTDSELLSIFADNSNGLITAQNIRDLVVSKPTSHVYNASLYGVVADNSADNSVALNSLIDRVGLDGGGCIELPPGRIRFSSTLDFIGNPYVIIRGRNTIGTSQNTYASELIYTGTTGPAIRSNSTSRLEFLAVRWLNNLTGYLIDFSKVSGGSDASFCSMEYVFLGSIYGRGFDYSPLALLLLNGSHDHKFNNVIFNGGQYQVIGKLTEGQSASGGYAIATKFDSCSFSNYSIASIRNADEGWLVSNCVFECNSAESAAAYVEDTGFHSQVLWQGNWIADDRSTAPIGTWFSIAKGTHSFIGNSFGCQINTTFIKLTQNAVRGLTLIGNSCIGGGGGSSCFLDINNTSGHSNFIILGNNLGIITTKFNGVLPLGSIRSDDSSILVDTLSVLSGISADTASFTGSVNASNAVVGGGIGNQLLIQPASMETSQGVANIQYWQLQSGGTTGLASTSSPVYHGSYSLSCTVSSSTSAIQVTGSGAIDVVPGKTYYALVAVRAASNGSVGQWVPSIGFFDGAGSAVAATQSTIFYPVNSTGWTLIAFSLTAPTGATKARVGVRGQNLVANEVYYFDAVYLSSDNPRGVWSAPGQLSSQAITGAGFIQTATNGRQVMCANGTGSVDFNVTGGNGGVRGGDGSGNVTWAISGAGAISATSISSGLSSWKSGTGSPEGVVTAVVGSLYTRTDGGAGTTLYIKETGSGNTGWVAK